MMPHSSTIRRHQTFDLSSKLEALLLHFISARLAVTVKQTATVLKARALRAKDERRAQKKKERGRKEGNRMLQRRFLL